MNKQKRLADWLEKMSVALTVGSMLADKGFWLPFIGGTVCFVLSMKLMKNGAEK